jgi:hypothetical protein
VVLQPCWLVLVSSCPSTQPHHLQHLCALLPLLVLLCCSNDDDDDDDDDDDEARPCSAAATSQQSNNILDAQTVSDSSLRKLRAPVLLGWQWTAGTAGLPRDFLLTHCCWQQLADCCFSDIFSSLAAPTSGGWGGGPCTLYNTIQ